MSRALHTPLLALPALQVASNVDKGPLARKRDVGFIYHQAKLRDLQQQAAELEVQFPFSIQDKR